MPVDHLSAETRGGCVLNEADDAYILIARGGGTIDADGNVLQDRLRLVTSAVFGVLALVQAWGDRIAGS